MTSHEETGNFIIPPDELIFFRGVGIPPTSFCGATVRMRGYNAIISASGRGGQWQMACHLLGELLAQTSTWSFEKQLPQDRNIWTPRGLLYAFISYIWEAYRFEFIIPYWSRPDISNISWPMRMSCEGVQPDVISFLVLNTNLGDSLGDIWVCLRLGYTGYTPKMATFFDKETLGKWCHQPIDFWSQFSDKPIWEMPIDLRNPNFSCWSILIL